jgi:hypothetical protein
MRRIVLGLVLAALAYSPAALAHGGAPGFTSTVRVLRPPVPGVSVRVLEHDDRLLLENTGNEDVVILGYDGEPYLRFSGGRVYENLNSPSKYLNGDRYGNVKLPPNANAKATPRWVIAARSDEFDWHDHRIHWMSPIPPAKVQTAPNARHHVFDWRVPGLAAGRRFTIAGSLDYAPVPKRTLWPFVVVGGAAIVLLSAAGLVVVSRRDRTTSPGG